MTRCLLRGEPLFWVAVTGRPRPDMKKVKGAGLWLWEGRIAGDESEIGCLQ